MVHVIVDLLFLKGKSHQYSYEFFSPLSHCFTIFIILCCNIRMITISIFNIRLSSKENKYYSFAKKYLSYKVWYTWNNLASTDHLILYFMNYLTIQTSLWSKHQNWHIFNWYCFVHVSYQKWKKFNNKESLRYHVFMFKIEFFVFVLMSPLWRHNALNLKHVFKSIHSTLGELIFIQKLTILRICF